MWQIMAFFVGALVIAGFSARFLAHPRSHGFFRFLALVALWAVFISSLPWWSRDVLSARQIVSWILIAGALALALTAYILLYSATRTTARKPPQRTGVEQASGLVTTGPYRYIRHPILASLVLLAWGLALKSGSFGGFFLALIATGLLYITALTEEEENLERFGGAYEEYMTATRMFVPGLF